MEDVHIYTVIVIFLLLAVITVLLKDVKRCPYCKHYMHRYGYKKRDGKLFKYYFCTSCGHESVEEVKKQ